MVKWRYWMQHITGQIKGSPWYHKVSVTILSLFILIAIFNSLLCNDKPLLAKTEDGKWEFPAFYDFKNDISPGQKTKYIQKKNYGFALYPPVRYAYHSLSPSDLGAKPPGYSYGKANIWYTNWLGTDELGRDVVAGLARGLYHSFRIAILSTFFSVVLGSVIGMFLGFMGNHTLKVNGAQLFVSLLSLFLIVFYLWYEVYWWAAVIAITGRFVFKKAGRLNLNQYSVPVESMGVGIITIRKSIPTLILLFGLLPLFKNPGAVNLIFILSLIGWTSIAWIVRIHTREVTSKDFIASALSIGSDPLTIVFRHIYPNIRNNIVLLFIFQLGAMITLEAALSYLGVGIAPEEVSLGTMLKQAKSNINHWWLAVFPGAMLTLILLCLHMIYEYRQKRVFDQS